MTVRDLLKLPQKVKRYPVGEQPTASAFKVRRPTGAKCVFDRANASSYIKVRLVRYFLHNVPVRCGHGSPSKFAGQCRTNLMSKHVVFFHLAVFRTEKKTGLVFSLFS